MKKAPKTQPASPARFVDMTAWTLALLGGYGIVRFAFMAIRELQVVPPLPQTEPHDLAGWLGQHAFGMSLAHCTLCICIVVLAIGLLWRRRWSRSSVVVLGTALAIYLVSWATYLMLGSNPDQAEGSAWEMVQWVIAIMLVLLAAIAALLARRFNSKGIRNFFQEEHDRQTG